MSNYSILHSFLHPSLYIMFSFLFVYDKALNWYISGLFKGIPVARLPFTPLSIFRKLTHRLLDGEDYRDASSHLILMLASMSIRGSIAKIFGGGPPKVIGKVGAFDMPDIDK